MYWTGWGIFVLCFQNFKVGLAVDNIQLPEIDYLAKNLNRDECMRFYKLLNHRRAIREKAAGFHGRERSHSSPCINLLAAWVTDPAESNYKAHENVELRLRQIGRTDLAQWLGYNMIHQRQLADVLADSGVRMEELEIYEAAPNYIRIDPSCTWRKEKYSYGCFRGGKGGRGSVHRPALEGDDSSSSSDDDSEGNCIIRKLLLVALVVFLMILFCVCFYRFIYLRMRGGLFSTFNQSCGENDEESFLNGDTFRTKCTECCLGETNTKQSFWKSVNKSSLRPFSLFDHFKRTFGCNRQKVTCNDNRGQQLRSLTVRLQKTCPAERKIIHLSRQEQRLLKSLTDAEKRQLPATDSDLKFMLASDRDKKKLLAHECRREFLVDLRKRLEKVRPEGRKTIVLNDTERKYVRKLTPSERLLLPLMDKDLQILVASPIHKRQIMLKQMAGKLAGIAPEDRKYLELDSGEKEFLIEMDEKEKKKLGISDTDLQFIIATPSQRSVMQQKLETGKRNQRIDEIKRKLETVNYDVACLKLSRVEHSLFISLSNHELDRLGLTNEHVKYYAASDSERKALWPSPSQHRNLKINALQTKLTRVPWKQCNAVLTASERELLISLTPDERQKLRISDSDKNFMLGTDSEKEIIQRQRNVMRLKLKLRDLDSTPLTESERMLLLTLTPSEMQKVDLSSADKKLLLANKSEKDERALDARVHRLKDKLDKDNNAELTEADRILLSSLTAQEMARMNMSAPQLQLLLSNVSEKDTILRRKRLDVIKEKIKSDGAYNVRLTDSDRMLMGTLSAAELGIIKITPSQLSFLMLVDTERKLMTDMGGDRRMSKRGLTSTGSNTPSLVCNRPSGKPSTCSTHSPGSRVSRTPSNISTHSAMCPCKALSRKTSSASTRSACVYSASSRNPSEHSTRSRPLTKTSKSQFDSSTPRVQFANPESSEIMNAGVEAGHKSPPGTPSGDSNYGGAGESLDESELSETYDELGMLFSQHMKEQARPCQRKYCLLGRHLKKNNHHDERQCQIRHNCYRGCPNDQRPACSSGNVCKDTYDEYNLMHAPPSEKRQLNNTIYERRKQFLDQPCCQSPGPQFIPPPKSS